MGIIARLMMSKGKILETAVGLFCKYGIRMMSMDELAHELGVSKKTIYVHYKEKDELVLDCINTIVGILQKQIKLISDKKENPILKICDIYVICLQVILKYPPTFFYDLRKFHSGPNSVLEDFRDKLLFKTISNLLHQSKEQGFISEDIDVKFLCEIHFFRFLELMDNRSTRNNYSLDKIFQHLIITNLRGILVAKHIEMLDYYEPNLISIDIFVQDLE